MILEGLQVCKSLWIPPANCQQICGEN